MPIQLPVSVSTTESGVLVALDDSGRAADVAFQWGDLAGVARELHAAAACAHEVGGRLARWQVLRTQAVLAQAQARFDDARRLGLRRS